VTRPSRRIVPRPSSDGTPKAVCCDVDGVLFRGRRPLAGTRPFLGWLADRGVPLALLTNHAEADPGTLAAAVARLGYAIDVERVVTSSTLAARYMREQGVSSVAVVGGPRLRAALVDQGLRVVAQNAAADAVVVGHVNSASSGLLANAAARIRAGAAFYATNADVLVPQRGGFGLETGAWLALLTAASGRVPFVLGKPSAFAFQHACAPLGVALEDTVMVGDTPETDIDGASAAGMITWRVRSGNAPDDAAADRRADATFNDVGAIAEHFGWAPGREG
jgi:HAD superfamily hydrolase (TIGR01450 family)